MGAIRLGDVAELPPTIDLMTAAALLGIGRTRAYEMAKFGTFPCRVIRIGAVYRIPTVELLRVLGLADSVEVSMRGSASAPSSHKSNDRDDTTRRERPDG